MYSIIIIRTHMVVRGHMYSIIRTHIAQYEDTYIVV
jgi:hypothetical protein